MSHDYDRSARTRRFVQESQNDRSSYDRSSYDRSSYDRSSYDTSSRTVIKTFSLIVLFLIAFIVLITWYLLWSAPTETELREDTGSVNAATPGLSRTVVVRSANFRPVPGANNDDWQLVDESLALFRSQDHPEFAADDLTALA